MEEKTNKNGNQSWRNKLRLPSRKFLPRKFASTSRFVVSSRVWSNMIPTRDCDILITFPTNTSDATLMWILARLRNRTPELRVHVRHHSNTGVYGFYLTATYENLLKGAEELGIQKPMKEEFGGGMREFSFDDTDCFLGVEDSTCFLTSQERQSVVYHLLLNLQAISGDQLGKVKFLEGQAIVPVLISKGIVRQVLPLHSHDVLAELKKTWVQAFFRKQPREKICEYFGVKIAMYFSYLGHYTKALVLPAIFGVILWFLSGTSQVMDDACFVIFAFLNVLWATLYLEHWKRTSSELAYQWGTLDREDELLVEPRPLYQGNLVVSPVTGRLERHYPAWKHHLFFYCVSVPVMCVCLIMVFVTMFTMFQLQDWVNEKIAAGEYPYVFKYLPKVLLALAIGMLDEVYKRVACWLNDMENYRLEETYENQLIIKLILFQFVNSFLSLFYIAFYLGDMDRLREQLAALLITRQVIGNIKEALLPYFLEKAKLLKMGYDMTANMSPTSLERQANIIRENSTDFSGSNSPETESSGLPEGESIPKGQGHSEGHDEGQGDDHEIKTGDNFCEEKTDEKKIKQTLNFENIKDLKHTEEKLTEDFNKEKEKLQEDISRAQTPEMAEDEEQMNVQYSGPTLTQAEVESAMKKYEDTYEDYLEMFIQFGYVTLFSPAFPMAALCAFLNNIVEIRSDAFKLCVTFQRPFGQRVQDIGAWQDALELMSVIAVIVNSALVGMSGLAKRLFPDWSTAERIVLIIILEHVILAFRILLAYAIPDIPHWVAEEKARLEFRRRAALKRMESQHNGSSRSGQGHRSQPTESSSTKYGYGDTVLAGDKTQGQGTSAPRESIIRRRTGAQIKGFPSPENEDKGQSSSMLTCDPRFLEMALHDRKKLHKSDLILPTTDPVRARSVSPVRWDKHPELTSDHLRASTPPVSSSKFQAQSISPLGVVRHRYSQSQDSQPVTSSSTLILGGNRIKYRSIVKSKSEDRSGPSWNGLGKPRPRASSHSKVTLQSTDAGPRQSSV